ncbi:hypothetical protein OEZ86_005959 [Tetradesmus obliquus]|nr:hypothetical protein OEZ86_005959 [Tetradesmus obliquus]
MAQPQSEYQQQMTVEQQDLPFACFQPPPAPQQQRPEQIQQQQQQQQQLTHQQPQQLLTGVCILRQEQGEPQASSSIDTSVLQNAGLKIRPSSSCTPDIIISAPALPAPLAVVVVQPSAQSPGSSMDSPAFLQRCASMANTSRLSCVLVPHTLATHSAVLDIACGNSFNSKIMLQYYTPQEGAAACILQLAISLAMASDEQAAVAEQHLSAATSTDALQACLAGLAACGPALPTAEQMWGLLALGYGSLHQLAVGATAEDVAACIGCTEQQGQQIWWLFNGVEA